MIRTLYIMIQKRFMIASFIIFQLLWAACVLGKNEWLGISVLFVAIHFLLSPNKSGDVVRVPLLALMGIAMDMLWIASGVFIFPENYFPLWLAILWLGFASTFYVCFAWLIKLPMYLQGIIGGLGGMFSYLVGHNLNAVGFSYSYIMTSVLLFCGWAAMVILYCRLSRWRMFNVTVV